MSAVVPGAGLLMLGILAGCGPHAPQQRAPQSVPVTTVLQQDVPIQGEWPASLDGNVNARIQPQVSGYLIKQDYREGAFVHKGELLFEIDPRPFQATLDMAKAQLAQARAQLGNATLNVTRDVPEAEAGAIPRAQLDTDTQTKLAASAAVEAGEAAVEQAELNLGFTRVRSLIDGIAGITQVQVGNLVTPSTVLTSVSDVNPIRAYFPVTTEEYLRMAAPAGHGPDAPSVAGLPLHLLLSDGSTHPSPGVLLFADRQVDAQTGTIRLVGAFPNPGNVLRPGEYGKVRAVTVTRKGALLVPQRAVTELQGAQQVALVGPDDKVSIRTVQVGERVGALWIVASGLKPGDRVVVEGTSKVQDGSLVTPVPYQPTGQNGQDSEAKLP
jgi:RND family efflux transporter MFP subunit